MDDVIRHWRSEDGRTEIIREPGAEPPNFQPLNTFGLFFDGHLIVDGRSFEYVTNYHWRELAVTNQGEG